MLMQMPIFFRWLVGQASWESWTGLQWAWRRIPWSVLGIKLVKFENMKDTYNVRASPSTPLVWASTSVDQCWVVIRNRNRLLTVIKMVLRIHNYGSQINPKTWVWYMITVLQRTEHKIK
jgi:hypothetical protein